MYAVSCNVFRPLNLACGNLLAFARLPTVTVAELSPVWPGRILTVLSAS